MQYEIRGQDRHMQYGLKRLVFAFYAGLSFTNLFMIAAGLAFCRDFQTSGAVSHLFSMGSNFLWFTTWFATQIAVLLFCLLLSGVRINNVDLFNEPRGAGLSALAILMLPSFFLNIFAGLVVLQYLYYS
ncbi:hypothetical protein HAP94_16695 [Acidithiobacillus ferrivorans]|nr:hypothetical protein [Acidithiobacillus ferrivorans]